MGESNVKPVSARVAQGFGVLGAVVRLPGMRNLQLGWLAVTASDAAIGIALAVHVFVDGGAVAVGLIAAARTLPAIVAGPLLSVFVDRFTRRTALTAGVVIRVLAVSGMVVAIVAGAPTWVLYTAAALDTALASMFWPGVAALVPYLAGSSRDLTTANAATSIVESVGSLAGPIGAGLVLALSGPTALLAGVAILLLVAAMSVWSVRVPGDAGTAVHGRHVLSAAFGGFATLRRSRGPAAIVGVWTIESIVLGAIDVVIVVLAVDVLDLGEAGVGYLAALVGLGGVLGAAFMVEATRERRAGATFIAALVFLGLSVAGTGWTVSAWIPAVALFVGGLASAQVDVSAQTLLQRTVDSGELGRVLGTFEGLYWGSLGVGALLAAWLVSSFGLSVAVGVIAVVLVATALAARSLLGRIDREVKVPQHAMRMLRNAESMALLSVPAVEHLARLAEPLVIPAGETLISEGGHDKWMYVISEGSLAVGAGGKQIAVLGQGDIVGEVAAFLDVDRTADVTAVEDTRVLRLPGDVVVATVTGHAPTADVVESMIVGRMARTGHGRRAGR